MATANDTSMDRSRLLEAARGDLSRTHTLLSSCRRMTEPLDVESVQIEETVQMALRSLSVALEHVEFCNDILGGA